MVYTTVTLSGVYTMHRVYLHGRSRVSFRGGGRGHSPPPWKLAAPPLGIATTHMHNVYVHVEVSPVSMAKLSKSDILLIFNQ